MDSGDSFPSPVETPLAETDIRGTEPDTNNSKQQSRERMTSIDITADGFLKTTVPLGSITAEVSDEISAPPRTPKLHCGSWARTEEGIATRSATRTRTAGTRSSAVVRRPPSTQSSIRLVVGLWSGHRPVNTATQRIKSARRITSSHVKERFCFTSIRTAMSWPGPLPPLHATAVVYASIST